MSIDAQKRPSIVLCKRMPSRWNDALLRVDESSLMMKTPQIILPYYSIAEASFPPAGHSSVIKGIVFIFQLKKLCMLHWPEMIKNSTSLNYHQILQGKIPARKEAKSEWGVCGHQKGGRYGRYGRIRALILLRCWSRYQRSWRISWKCIAGSFMGWSWEKKKKRVWKLVGKQSSCQSSKAGIMEMHCR